MITENDVRPLDTLLISQVLEEMMEYLITKGYPAQRWKNQMHRQYLKKAMKMHGGDLSKAARQVGMHRNSVERALSDEDKSSVRGRPTRKKALRAGVAAGR